jgi:tRNA(fMet)-specific endonuclease VapC
VSGLVVDTSSWVAYFAGRRVPALEEALDEARVLLPPLVAAELMSGAMSRRQRGALESLLADLMPCETPLEHWFRVGALRRTLAAKGLSLSTPDAHVAQCAIDAGARLLTEDRVFARIASLTALRMV